MSEDVKTEPTVSGETIVVPEETTQFTPEQMQKRIDDLTKENEKYRKSRAEAIAQAREAEEKALSEQGKYKELYDPLKDQFESLKSENSELISKVEAIETQRREELKVHFSAEEWEILGDSSIEKLSALAKVKPSKGTNVDPGGKKHLRSDGDFISREAYQSMTPEQQRVNHEKVKQSMKHW